MAVTSDITVFKTGYMGKYTNDEASSTYITVQVVIDSNIMQSQIGNIPANDYVCLFGDWSGIDTSISHDICAETVQIIGKIGDEGLLEYPILKGSRFNTSISANTNIFSSDLQPTSSPTYFRIYAAFDTAGILTVRRTRHAVTVSEKLNSGSNLFPDVIYAFDIIVELEEYINLQYSVAATILKLSVLEIGEGI